jgi:hypothetical protein
VQPEETQGFLRGFCTNSLNIVRESSTDIEKRDSAPATPAESVHTTPTYEPPKEQYDEDPVMPLNREEDPRRQDTSHEDEAEADKYFKQYLTASFHPVDIRADNSVRVIYPMVAQPADPITIQAVPNLTEQERKSSTRVRVSNCACQTETISA